ncbi:3-phosphoshikimate 1-carboxyvinyltransferase [Actinomyces bowdenii]|uniref:3-phosphoshikimate 1-carboxyvinyltransferase n=1 Tax=Actinomyces bowdenii TaxID=131109 RepID=A0A853EP57_9ACTO|nr:3-phosphoshikimate 1-carboxyvinyltransferase [Actinomyces bowdenii]MBF0697778.1 3-phosphoshikimate 1-carboxyvinyltransferase [Actinomyces bowdenii]NYS69951.1 3-phosphoshikimate 1-carboxyvinyltransferase [Actinomyces bowdenii]
MQPSPQASPHAWSAPRAAGPLDAVVALPGSKSLTARALVLAATAQEPTVLTGVPRSRDTALLVEALSRLGATAQELEAQPREPGRRLRITPAPLPPAGGVSIDCGLAGTVMRFVPALAALALRPVVFDGDEAARRRPMRPLLEALSALGARVRHLGEPGFLPIEICAAGGSGPGTDPGAEQPGSVAGAPPQVRVDASTSSQFLSALLLLGPVLPGGLEVRATGRVVSLPHVEMTVAALRGRGVVVEAPGAGDPARWRVHPGRPGGGQVAIEPDLSNAGPFLAAALVAGGTVRVPHWPAATTQAGDAWRELLVRLGGQVALERAQDGSQTLAVTGTGRVEGIDADLGDVGELAPTVAALAAVAGHQGRASRLGGIGHLRGHETDRLAALSAEIGRLGGRVEELDDGLAIHPAPLHGALLRSYADHRMATFAAVVGLAVDGIELDDVACTSKTLPGFTGLWSGMLSSRGGGR